MSPFYFAMIGVVFFLMRSCGFNPIQSNTILTNGSNAHFFTRTLHPWQYNVRLMFLSHSCPILLQSCLPPRSQTGGKCEQSAVKMGGFLLSDPISTLDWDLRVVLVLLWCPPPSLLSSLHPPSSPGLPLSPQRIRVRRTEPKEGALHHDYGQKPRAPTTHLLKHTHTHPHPYQL